VASVVSQPPGHYITLITHQRPLVTIRYGTCILVERIGDTFTR